MKVSVQLSEILTVHFQFNELGAIENVWGGSRLQNIEAANLLNKSAKQEETTPHQYLVTQIENGKSGFLHADIEVIKMH
jgi:hypothetical protein